MTISSFDRATLKVVRAKLEAALADCGLEGVTFSVGSMRFSANEVTIKVVGATDGAASDTVDFVKRMAQVNGLDRTEKDGWAMVDYHPKKPKYPFIVTSPTGARFKMSLNQVRAQFA